MSGSELFPVQKFPSTLWKLWEVCFFYTQPWISCNKAGAGSLYGLSRARQAGREGEINVGFLQVMPETPNTSFLTPGEVVHQDPAQSSAPLKTQRKTEHGNGILASSSSFLVFSKLGEMFESKCALLAECGAQTLSCWTLFWVSCCEVAAHLNIGLKDPKFLFMEGMSWNPEVQVLAGSEGGITNAVTTLHHPVELFLSA